MGRAEKLVAAISARASDARVAPVEGAAAGRCRQREDAVRQYADTVPSANASANRASPSTTVLCTRCWIAGTRVHFRRVTGSSARKVIHQEIGGTMPAHRHAGRAAVPPDS